jgi:hypothetical protein
VARASLHLLVVLLAAPAIAGAADSADAMAARYMRYEGCMVKRFGDKLLRAPGHRHRDQPLGAAEPTTTSLALQPPNVIAADAQCRKESALEKEPRPETERSAYAAVGASSVTTSVVACVISLCTGTCRRR